ncbi:hypothetical protein PR202_ga20153 [Eleusine coracana subsp. coracana]|uniref:PHD-type zinc finger plants domain-containing protein n=1 Tax=Eleusine coracana subsp. coracana TaxID=191504 RepID=A0AAV5CWM1_ELECO|nr:hypothetical protein PR202_ga20153 [Eleusine coracana subsp. coracana]
MCGDHGLGQELFRCKSCRVRLQHSYCSNLYPRATAYRRCNWCLVREPPPPAAQAGAGAAGHAATIAGNGSSNKPSAAEAKRKAGTTTASYEERHRRHEGCSLRRPPAELGYPVKKRQRKADDGRAPPDPGVKAGNNNAAGESNKEMMRAGKPRVRVKVQRYKLLAEVISC